MRRLRAEPEQVAETRKRLPYATVADLPTIMFNSNGNLITPVPA